MDHQLRINLPKSSTSQTQPVIISWTNPSMEAVEIDENHIKQEKELHIIQSVPLPVQCLFNNEDILQDKQIKISGAVKSEKYKESLQKDILKAQSTGSSKMPTIKRVPANSKPKNIPVESIINKKSIRNEEIGNQFLVKSKQKSSNSLPNALKIPKVEDEKVITTVKVVNIEHPVKIKDEVMDINDESSKSIDFPGTKSDNQTKGAHSFQLLTSFPETIKITILPDKKQETTDFGNSELRITRSKNLTNDINSKISKSTEFIKIPIECSKTSNSSLKRSNMEQISSESSRYLGNTSNFSSVSTGITSKPPKLLQIPAETSKTIKNKSNSSIFDDTSRNPPKLLPIPSEMLSNPPQKVIIPSTTSCIEDNEDNDDDDEKRLVIKEEEEELQIMDIDDKELTFGELPLYIQSKKRLATSAKIGNVPKKQKIQHEDPVPIIPYIPVVRRKSSTSSTESITSVSYPFQCKICKNTFRRKIDLIHHIKSHTEAKHKCQRCGMKFKFEGYFLKHECIACDICNETFVLKHLLRNHQRIVHGVHFDMYECDLCTKTLRYRHGLLYHMSKVHMKFLEDKFACDRCGKRFKLKESIRLHMKNHESVIACNLCGKKVKKINMNIHMKSVHVTERNFQCPQCQTSFKTKECLKSHIRTHDKSFKCTECGKKFANKSHLKEHIEWHQNPEAFKCIACDKTFAQKYCLKTHIRMHESGHDFTRFKCTICTYSTDNSDNMRKHEMKHKRQEENKELKKNWVKCEKCKQTFKNKLKLATHYWKKHSEVMPS